MNRIILFSFIIFIIVFSTFSRPIPFDPSSGIVEINVLIDGHISGKFGIDTGADRLYIDKQFALKNNIKILQAATQRNIQGTDGSAKAFAASIKSLEISDNVELKNISATVVDLSKISKGAAPPDGLIGFQILKEFYVSIDYPNSLLELSKEVPDFLRGRRYTEIPFTQYKNFILVDVVLNDELTVPMMLDYCASYTTITPKIADLLEIPILDNRRAIIPSVNIEGVESQNVWAFVSDLKEFKKSTPRAKFEGIIGGSFLHKYNITVDYLSKKIYIRN